MKSTPQALRVGIAAPHDPLDEAREWHELSCEERSALLRLEVLLNAPRRLGASIRTATTVARHAASPVPLPPDFNGRVLAAQPGYAVPPAHVVTPSSTTPLRASTGAAPAPPNFNNAVMAAQQKR